MATDARGHTVPGGSDAPKRADITGLGLSVRDPIPVTNTTTRAAKLAELAALTPAITPASDNPIYFQRADAGAGLELEFTTDGSTFHTIPATPNVHSREESGTKTVTVTAAAGATAAVSFTAGRFTSTPRVIVTKQGGNLAQFIPYVQDVTTAGCTVGLYAGDGAPATGSVAVAWLAVQA